MSLSKLCTPALIYFVLAVIFMVMGLMAKFQPVTLIIKGAFVLLWTWFLNYLCSKGYSGVSWFLVLMPYILMLLLFFIAVEAVLMSKKSGNNSGSMPPKKQQM